MRNLILVVLLLLSMEPACTFGTLPRETHLVTATGLPPCFTGDICADALFDLRMFH